MDHEWRPLGFTQHPACGGLVPTDQCAKCGQTRYVGGHENEPDPTERQMLAALRPVLDDAAYAQTVAAMKQARESCDGGRLVY